MIAPPMPYNERQRLEALRALNILDTDPEERFDRFTRLAAALFGVPIALVSLVDANRQWFKSRHGLDACETSREVSFCGHAILSDDVFVVEDAVADKRFFDNPLVTGDPRIRFYAGYPLSAPDGSNVGTLCVIGREPRKMTPEDLRLLRELGRSIEHEMVALSRATIDATTSLSNLRGFEAMAQHAMSLCQRLDHPITFLHLQLKNLGEISALDGLNNTKSALVEFSQMLLVAFRNSDVIGRIGEHEFGVMLTGTAERDARQPIRRLEEMLRDYNSQPGHSLPLDVNMAAVRYDPVHHRSVADLLAAAAQEAVTSAQAHDQSKAAAHGG